MNGAWEGNRTPDTRIFSPLLYRLSYPGIRRSLNKFLEQCLGVSLKLPDFLKN
jgi:hypothetical protein